MMFLFAVLVGVVTAQHHVEPCGDLRRLIEENRKYNKTGIFTKDNFPTAFKDLVTLHLPTLQYQQGKGGLVTLPGHPMTEEHHITDIYAISRGKEGAETCIHLGSTDKAILEFTPPAGTVEIDVLEHCNLHGVWGVFNQSYVAPPPKEYPCIGYLERAIEENERLGKRGVFTKTNFPDKFKDLVTLHVPEVTVTKGSGTATVTGHPMTQPHYITNIWAIFDNKYETCVSLNYTDAASYTFYVPEGVTNVTVFEHCNLHGVWANL